MTANTDTAAIRERLAAHDAAQDAYDSAVEANHHFIDHRRIHAEQMALVEYDRAVDVFMRHAPSDIRALLARVDALEGAVQAILDAPYRVSDVGVAHQLDVGYDKGLSTAKMIAREALEGDDK